MKSLMKSSLSRIQGEEYLHLHSLPIENVELINVKNNKVIINNYNKEQNFLNLQPKIIIILFYNLFYASRVQLY